MLGKKNEITDEGLKKQLMIALLNRSDDESEDSNSKIDDIESDSDYSDNSNLDSDCNCNMIIIKPFWKLVVWA